VPWPGTRTGLQLRHQRVHNEARPESWEIAARRWDDLERIPAAIRCRWRQAEAMVTAGEDRSSVMVPLLYAFAEATRLRAQPLIKEIENLARRARIDPATSTERPPTAPEPNCGLIPREVRSSPSSSAGIPTGRSPSSSP